MDDIIRINVRNHARNSRSFETQSQAGLKAISSFKKLPLDLKCVE